MDCPMRQVLLLCPFCRWGNRGFGSSNDWAQVTQLDRDLAPKHSGSRAPTMLHWRTGPQDSGVEDTLGPGRSGHRPTGPADTPGWGSLLARHQGTRGVQEGVGWTRKKRRGGRDRTSRAAEAPGRENSSRPGKTVTLTMAKVPSSSRGQGLVRSSSLGPRGIPALQHPTLSAAKAFSPSALPPTHSPGD